MFAPATSTLTSLTVLKALNALNSLFILVNLRSLLDFTVFALFTTLSMLYKKFENNDIMTIEKSNLLLNTKKKYYTFQLSSKYLVIPNPIIFIIHSKI